MAAPVHRPRWPIRLDQIDAQVFYDESLIELTTWKTLMEALLDKDYAATIDILTDCVENYTNDQFTLVYSPNQHASNVAHLLVYKNINNQTRDELDRDARELRRELFNNK